MASDKERPEDGSKKDAGDDAENASATERKIRAAAPVSSKQVAPPSKRAESKKTPPVTGAAKNLRGPSRTWLAVVGVGILVVTGLGIWVMTRKPAPSRRAPAAVASMPVEDDDEEEEREERKRKRIPAHLVTARPVLSAPPPERPVDAAPLDMSPIAVACRCMMDVTDSPAARWACVDQLRTSTAKEAKSCLEAFRDDPQSRKLMKELEEGDDENPSYDQEIIVAAQNALHHKALLERGALREAARQAAASAPPATPLPPTSASEAVASQRGPRRDGTPATSDTAKLRPNPQQEP